MGLKDNDKDNHPKPLTPYETKTENYRPIVSTHELAYEKALLIKEINRSKAIELLKTTLNQTDKCFDKTTTFCPIDRTDEIKQVYNYYNGKPIKDEYKSTIKNLVEIYANKSYKEGDLITSLLNILLVEEYTENIIKEITNKHKDDQISQINELLEQTTKEHKNILNNKYADYIFNNEVKKDICYILEDYARKIANLEHVPINNRVTQTIRKKLIWKGNKKQIGTILGALHKAGIIQGTQADLIRGINALFPDIPTDTIKKSVGLQVSSSTNSPCYDSELLELLEPIIKQIKKRTRNKPINN